MIHEFNGEESHLSDEDEIIESFPLQQRVSKIEFEKFNDRPKKKFHKNSSSRVY